MIVIENSRVRNILKIAVPFVVIPLLAVIGSIITEKHHIIISLAVAVFSLFLFSAGFEKKSTGSRRMVIVAVMIALCIVGRFIPLFKPVTAITVITAVYLGSEAGFLTGALAAFLSNFYFGQGPWTPFQMLAWGLIGLIAGYLSNPLRKHKVLLLFYGVASGIIYSFIMDIWTVLWYEGGFRWELYASAVVTALPHTVIYAVSNFVFLWFMAKPFGEKLERIKIKYGI